MKRISIIAIAVALAGVFASCQKETVAVYNPEKAVAPVLGTVTGCELSLSGSNLSVDYTPADFGVAIPSGHELMVRINGNGTAVKSSFSQDGASYTVSFAQKDLNTALLNLEAEAEKAVSVDFVLKAFLKNDKGAAICEPVYSEAVSAVFTPYSADLLDADVYPHVWVIGSGASIGAWGFDTIEQFLYDYEGSSVYTGIIDYQWDAAKGWKMTGTNAWDESCNYGLDKDAPAPDTEASSVQLISSGGSANISCYSKRFYKWEFNKSSLVLKKVYGFDNIGIVGSFNGWNAGDAACKMQYNATTHKFFIDYEFSAGDELKFTCDDSWDLNFGAGCAQGGDNIVVSAGKVRVYLDLNKNEYEFNASRYGTAEEGTVYNPEDPGAYPSECYMIGNFCGWNWDNCFEMVKVNGSQAKFWTMAYIKANEGFKFNTSKAWDGGDFTSLGTGNGFSVADGNCIVPEDGIYLMAVDYENNVLNVEKARIYGIGDCFGSWDTGKYEFYYYGEYAEIDITYDGNLRMYAASDYYNTDWWRMEFNIYDYKIVYRGDGGDQDPVPASAWDTVSLDFSVNAGSIY